MGILDDAIREHLDLKRRHGAGPDEVERLEKEAFGPPERPGDADVDEQRPAPAREAVEAAEPATERAEAEPAPADWLEDLEEEEVPEPAAEPSSQPVAEVEPSLEEEAEAPEEAAATPAEQARLDHPHLEDTGAHPMPDDVEAEAEDPEPLEAEIFDQQGEEGEEDEEDDLSFDDLDLDLDLEEPEGPSAAGDVGLAEGEELELEEPAAAEHPIPGYPREEEPALEEEGEDDFLEELEDEDDEDDEDLLEETPEFLQDTPEDERLWFEQRGRPKDFDFDD